MSYTVSFEIRLPDPADRSAALAACHRVATAFRFDTCAAFTMSEALVERVVRAHPRPLRASLFPDPFVIPPLAIRGRAIETKLYAVPEPPQAPVRVTYERDAAGELVTSLIVMSRVTEDLRAPIELARAVGALVGDPETILAAEAGTHTTVRIPVYADAFPLLASDAAFGSGAYTRSLDIRVAAEHAIEFLDSRPATPWADEMEITLAIADAATIALVDQAALADDLVIVWDHGNEWIENDGTLQRIELAIRGPATRKVCTVRFGVVLDHLPVERAAAVLAARAELPVVVVR